MPFVRSQTRRPTPGPIQPGPALGEAGLAQSRWRLEQRLLPRAPAPAQGSPQLSLVVTLAQEPLCGCPANRRAKDHTAAHSGPWRLEDHTPCLEATPTRPRPVRQRLYPIQTDHAQCDISPRLWPHLRSHWPAVQNTKEAINEVT